MRIANVVRLLMLTETTPSPLRGRDLQNVVLVGSQGTTADALQLACCTGAAASLLRFDSAIFGCSSSSFRPQTVRDTLILITQALGLGAINVLVLFALILDHIFDYIYT